MREQDGVQSVGCPTAQDLLARACPGPPVEPPSRRLQQARGLEEGQAPPVCLLPAGSGVWGRVLSEIMADRPIRLYFLWPHIMILQICRPTGAVEAATVAVATGADTVDVEGVAGVGLPAAGEVAWGPAGAAWGTSAGLGINLTRSWSLT